MTMYLFTKSELRWFTFNILVMYWDLFFGVRSAFQGRIGWTLFFAVMAAIQTLCTYQIVHLARSHATRAASDSKLSSFVVNQLSTSSNHVGMRKVP